MVKKYLLALVSMIPMCASAGFSDGKELDQYATLLTQYNNGKKLTDHQFMDVSYFQGYIAGVYDTGDGVLFCTNGKANLKQMTDITTMYLSKYPEKRDIQGADLVVNALSEKFPCKK
ncbi:Rap1a/Tai family immunity protein [Providencia rettgeri]